MPNKTRWTGLLIYSTGELIYSRDRHDMHRDVGTKQYAIDGGSEYCKIITPPIAVSGRDYDIVQFSLPDGVNAYTLHTDWNLNRFNYGWTTFDKANVDGPITLKGVEIVRINKDGPIFARPNKPTIPAEKSPDYDLTGLEKQAKTIRDLRASLTDDDLDHLAAVTKWGTYGPNGDQPRVDKPLNQLDTDHLENILITQRHISWQISCVILHILKNRYGWV